MGDRILVVAARKRHTDTVESSRPSATFSHIIFIVDTIDRDRYEIIPRGRHRARCVSRPMSCSRDATPGRGGGRGVAYACAYTRRYPRRVTYFPAALPGVRYGLWYCGRIPRRGGERRDPHGRRFQVRFQVRFPKKWIRFFFPFVGTIVRDLGPSPIGR